MTAPENMDIEDRPVPPAPRMARQRNVERPLDAARRLDFNVNDEDNVLPPAPLRLVRQHAQILQDDEDEDENAMDLEGGSRKKRKNNRRKNKRKTNKRKSRGGSKKRRRSVRKSRRSRK